MPRIALVDRPEGQVLEVAWGELEAGLYRLDLTEALVRDGVARLTVRADQQQIDDYTVPASNTPGSP